MNKFIENTQHWFYCDNIVHPMHQNQIGLLHMAQPQVFILIRNTAELYPGISFHHFQDAVAEINFFYPEEREHTDIEKLLTDAWNFLALQEQREEEYMQEEMFDDNDI